MLQRLRYRGYGHEARPLPGSLNGLCVKNRQTRDEIGTCVQQHRIRGANQRAAHNRFAREREILVTERHR